MSPHLFALALDDFDVRVLQGRDTATDAAETATRDDEDGPEPRLLILS